MRQKNVPTVFVTDPNDASRDIRALQQLYHPTEAQNIVAVIAGSEGDELEPEQVSRVLALCPSSRFLRLWLDPVRAVDDLTKRINPSLQSNQLSHLRTLCLDQLLPERFVASILSHTPQLQELEVQVAPYQAEADDSDSDSEETSPAEAVSTDAPYPQYPFRLLRLAYFGDGEDLFCHLFALSRSTISWLAFTSNPGPGILQCLEQGNLIQQLFFTLRFEYDYDMPEPSTAYQIVAALPRLAVLVLSADELSSYPELLSRCGAPLRRLVLICDADTIVSNAAETLTSLVDEHAPAVHQLREIAFKLDPTVDPVDYPHESLAELHTACAANHIRISQGWCDEYDPPRGRFEGVLAFFDRLTA